MRFTIPFTVTRDVPFPVEQAFEWFTDYGEGDAGRTDAVIDERRVLAEDEDRIVLEETASVAGRSASGRAVVDLDPPDRWEATIVEGGARPEGSRFVYELDETGPESCRLTATYDIRVDGVLNRVKIWFAREDVQRELEEMWDGFLAAMEEELAGEGAGSGA